MELMNRRGKSDAASQDGLDLDLLVSCPQCGGESSWDLKERLHRCSFCNSVLYWPPDKKSETFLVAEDKLAPQGAIEETLAFVDATRTRAAMIGRLIDEVEQSQREAARLRAEEKVPSVYDLMHRILPEIKVARSLALHVPYRVVQATLAFRALGRSGARKLHRTFFFLLEEIEPAYGENFDFRDKGLWFSKTTLRPLAPEMLTGGLFIAPSGSGADRQEILRHYLRRTDILKADMEPISYESEAMEWKEWTVFRPFHLVFGKMPSESGWLLLDGQFATIAGRPDDAEAEMLASGSWPRVEKERALPPEIKVIPFRCGTCGNDLELDPAALYQLCGECGRLFEPVPEGLREFSYKTLEVSDVPWRSAANSANKAWLPFWTFAFEWSAGEQGGNDILEMAILVPGVRPGSVPEPPPCGRLIYVPAFEGWTWEQYDDWSFEAAHALSTAPHGPSEARLYVQAGVAKGDKVIHVAVPDSIAASLFPGDIPSYFPPETQVKLNPILLKQLSGSRITAKAPSLVYVPIPCVSVSGELQLKGPRISVGLSILKSGSCPPVLGRTVRRRLEMAKGKR